MDQLYVNIPSSIHAPPQTPTPLLDQQNPSWNTMLDQDEYDDEVGDLPPSSPKRGDKQVRRRSSKACDQCRKSKCKCERSLNKDEPCKNCVLLGTPCTFLGPSRKRGPPKGYIDAIESRLHQMEALLGTLLSTPDPRVRSLIDDLADDALTRDILQKVDESPFGSRSVTGGTAPAFEDRAARILRTSVPVSSEVGTGKFANPSVEWQEHLRDRLKKGAEKCGTPWEEEEQSGAKVVDQPMNGSDVVEAPTKDAQTNVDAAASSTGPPKLTLNTSLRRSSHPSLAAHEHVESPRQRRRLGSASLPQLAAAATQTKNTPSLSPPSSSAKLRSYSRTPSTPSDDSSDDELLASAVGQLSINEDSQLRYHGPASGLHILGLSDRLDKRNEGGLWRFPKAGVWPRASRPRQNDKSNEWEMEWGIRNTVLPSLEEQVELIQLYWAYVHPVLPVLDREVFCREFRGEPDPEPSKCSPSPSLTSPVSPAMASISGGATGECRVATLLLLAMFAIAARYKTEPADPIPMNENEMWNAGDEYLEAAKRMLNQTYASSRPSTCQALLLLSYREIGIGAMAQAWLYTGMAVRMAQDLGIHRSADKWQRTGAELFSERERQVRRQIWYSCVIMDKYVSTYIGRPLSIFDRDFDTTLPTEDPIEEMRLWTRHASPCAGGNIPDTQLPSHYVPVPSRVIATFNASARLSCILSNIVESIYSVQPLMNQSRHQASVHLEELLDKWYFELPEYLQLPAAMSALSTFPSGMTNGAEGNDISNSTGGAVLPPPHVLTLHMMYWCSVLLLHRPFIHRKLQQINANALHNNSSTTSLNVKDKEKEKEKDRDKEEVESSWCQKAFELCAMAATKISNIVVLYQQNFCIKRCPAFFTFYLFSAGIMHMTTLWVRPGDVQATRGLQQCTDVLLAISTLWPSAGRAWELLRGSKTEVQKIGSSRQANGRDKRKRVSDNEHEQEEPQEIVLMQAPSAVYENRQVQQQSKGISANEGSVELMYITPPSQQGTSSLSTLASLQPHRHVTLHHPLPQQHAHQPPTSAQPRADQYIHSQGQVLTGSPSDFQTSSWPLQQTSDLSSASGTYGAPQSNGLSFSPNHYDSPKTDLWKDFPTDQFGLNNPALITSSLYGLPVISSTGAAGPLPGIPGPTAQVPQHNMHTYINVEEFEGIFGMQDISNTNDGRI